MTRTLVLLGCLAAATLSTSCASVSVHKVGEDQKEQGPDGVRFYRNRPYVAVHEPFVISATPYLTSGYVTADGKFIGITSGNTDPELAKVLKGVISSDGTIPSQRVLLTTPEAVGAAAAGGRTQSNLIDAAGAPQHSANTTPGSPTPQPGAGTGESGSAPKPASPEKEKTGQGQFTVRNDNAAIATQPMRRYFDITYLPDFEEDYVVKVEPRFGNASATLALGQGWSLQGLDAKVDNDAITSRLFDLYDKSIAILLQLGKTALGIPGPVGGAVQSGLLNADQAKLPQGTPLTIKITLVRIVAPGLYPILKPKEGQYVNANIKALKDSFANLEDRILVPVYPLTNIAFNTYSVVVVEAATAVGDSPLRMQQYVDARGTKAAEPTVGEDLNSEGVRAAIEKEIQAALKQELPGEKLAVTVSATADGTARVRVRRSDGASLEDQAIKDRIENAVDKIGVRHKLNLQTEVN